MGGAYGTTREAVCGGGWKDGEAGGVEARDFRVVDGMNGVGIGVGLEKVALGVLNYLAE